jgi:hypothetical protein
MEMAIRINAQDFISWYIRRHLGPDAQWLWLMTNPRIKVEPIENEQERGQYLADWFMSLEVKNDE